MDGLVSVIKCFFGPSRTPVPTKLIYIPSVSMDVKTRVTDGFESIEIMKSIYQPVGTVRPYLRGKWTVRENNETRRRCQAAVRQVSSSEKKYMVFAKGRASRIKKILLFAFFWLLFFRERKVTRVPPPHPRILRVPSCLFSTKGLFGKALRCRRPRSLPPTGICLPRHGRRRRSYEHPSRR